MFSLMMSKLIAMLADNSFDRSLSGTMWHSKQNDSLDLEEARLVEWMEMYRKFDKVVITLASGDRGQGFDPHSLQGWRSFPTFGRTGSNLSTFGMGMAVYVSTSPIHRGRRY
ncbi:hypothetical protein Tco_0359006 [Tanacetum coccineum]